jgi:isoleucyl-tRNA synthetase
MAGHLYLEGTDQYRGWFQSSLLTSIAWKGVAPYKWSAPMAGWLDGEGAKCPNRSAMGWNRLKITDQYGRGYHALWVCFRRLSCRYPHFKRYSQTIVRVYRKIRNYPRYILGNLFDFDPHQDAVSNDQLTVWTNGRSPVLTSW